MTGALPHNAPAFELPVENAVGQLPRQQEFPSTQFQPMEESAYATLSEAAISSADMPLAAHVSDEFLRRDHSTEHSFAGSIAAMSNSRYFLLVDYLFGSKITDYILKIVEWMFLFTKDLMDPLIRCRQIGFIRWIL